MNKAEQQREIKQLHATINDLKHSNIFLLSQQRELKHLAEKAGSEIAHWKHKFIKLMEQRHKEDNKNERNTKGEECVRTRARKINR